MKIQAAPITEAGNVIVSALGSSALVTPPATLNNETTATESNDSNLMTSATLIPLPSDSSAFDIASAGTTAIALTAALIPGFLFLSRFSVNLTFAPKSTGSEKSTSESNTWLPNWLCAYISPMNVVAFIVTVLVGIYGLFLKFGAAKTGSSSRSQNLVSDEVGQRSGLTSGSPLQSQLDLQTDGAGPRSDLTSGSLLQSQPGLEALIPGITSGGLAFVRVTFMSIFRIFRLIYREFSSELTKVEDQQKVESQQTTPLRSSNAQSLKFSEHDEMRERILTGNPPALGFQSTSSHFNHGPALGNQSGLGNQSTINSTDIE